MRSLPIALSALLLFGVAACKSNPYDGKPAVTTTVQSSPTPSPTPKPTPAPTPAPSPTPLPTFSLDAPDVMKFVVGTKGEYIVRGSVPAPGQPQISFAPTLPGSATYNTTSQKVSWTPTAGDIGTKVVQIRLIVLQIQLVR